MASTATCYMGLRIQTFAQALQPAFRHRRSVRLRVLTSPPYRTLLLSTVFTDNQWYSRRQLSRLLTPAQCLRAVVNLDRPFIRGAICDFTGCQLGAAVSQPYSQSVSYSQ